MVLPISLIIIISLASSAATLEFSNAPAEELNRLVCSYQMFMDINEIAPNSIALHDRKMPIKNISRQLRAECPSLTHSCCTTREYARLKHNPYNIAKYNMMHKFSIYLLQQLQEQVKLAKKKNIIAMPECITLDGRSFLYTSSKKDRRTFEDVMEQLSDNIRTMKDSYNLVHNRACARCDVRYSYMNNRWDSRQKSIPDSLNANSIAEDLKIKRQEYNIKVDVIVLEALAREYLCIVRDDSLKSSEELWDRYSAALSEKTN